MSDIRSILNKLEQINEAQNHQFLNDVVDKYAKDGMTLEDLARMEQEAEAAEPPEGGFLNRVSRGLLTRSYKKKYALAHAADKLGLPGLYDSQGRNFFYLDSEGEAAGAGGADKGDAEAIHAKGLLPDRIAQRFDLQTSQQEPQTAPQSDDEVDTDSRDQGSQPQQQAAQGSGELKLSDGSSFSRGQQSQRLLDRKAAQLVRRYNELVRKMNESAPVSLRGYLKEYNLQDILLEALTPEEEKELQQVYQDLNAIATYTDDQGPLISDANKRLLTQRLSQAPDVARRTGGTQTATPGAQGDAPAGGAPPEAQQASDASGDQDARVEPGDAPSSSSLEAFARSGKGGLANDPDEVDAIKELQQFLTDLGFDPRGVDGKYGGGTIAAVKEFQKFMGAKEDGDAGPETIGKIIQLRTIRWGDGGSKTFAEFRRALARAEELINKAGSGNVAAAPTTQTQSIDFRHLISIVEGKLLTEALSDQEKEELQTLLTQLDTLANDADWSSALPQPTQQRLAKIVQDGKAAVPAAPEGEPAADAEEPEDTRSDAAQAADPDGDGNADDPEAQVFAGEPAQVQSGAQFNVQTAANNIKDAISGIGTDEDAVYAAIDSAGSSQNWNAVVRAYPDVYKDIYGDFGGSDLEQVRSKLQAIGVTMPSEEEAEAQADAAADAAGAAARGETPPAGGTQAQQPQGPFLNGMVITPDIQQRLDAIGRDRGINGEPLSADDISALNSGVQSGEITAPTEITAGRNSAVNTPQGDSAADAQADDIARLPNPTDERSAQAIIDQAARDEALISKLPPADQAILRRLIQGSTQ